MSLTYTTTFSLIEWLAVTGLAQSALILVYILFRARNWRQAFLALAYFLTLAFAFGLQFSLRLEDYAPVIRVLLWLCWSLSPPLCYLLVLQIARGVDMPPLRQFWVLALVPAALSAAVLMRDAVGFFQGLYWLGAFSGGISMLALWGHKGLFSDFRKEKGGREKYWLIMVLIIANVMVVAIDFLRSSGNLSGDDADALLVTLGMGFLYLASTALFRVYPPPVVLNALPRGLREELTAEEKEIAARIKTLMEVDKLYHEPTFSRADLAREVKASESIVSRVINVSFGKSFPQLLHQLRVEDAKRMLQNPEIPIQVAAFEVGFNSLASFNRAFREVTGETPSQYRAVQAASTSV